jgi:hypothetical protein
LVKYCGGSNAIEAVSVLTINNYPDRRRWADIIFARGPSTHLRSTEHINQPLHRTGETLK